MGSAFKSPEEFREVLDRIFAMMSEHAEVGPRLRAADVPQQFTFSDVGLVVNIRPTRDGEAGNLFWEWSEDVDWDHKVRMEMSSEVANKYFQGKENVPIAVARRRIKSGGDMRSALALIPMVKPIYPLYAALAKREYPHLVV